MRHVPRFRALLVALWVLPAAIAVVDLAAFATSPHATAITLGGPVTDAMLWREQVSLWLGVAAGLSGLVATTGLWTFRRWSIATFFVAVALYGLWLPVAGWTVSGGFQLALLVQGLCAGGVATWLLVARDALPFASLSAV
jgi:hypothetical protein